MDRGRLLRRYIEKYLKSWKDLVKRKPIILRGARQVGKTYVVQRFGEAFERYVEINFEQYPDAKLIFERDLDPKRIVRDLSIFTNSRIEPGKTLLFFDEVQAAPDVIKSLRYFYEKLPDLHIIAAGSLIDFALEKEGVPVGRVSFLYLYPLSFLEYLDAMGRDDLLDEIENSLLVKDEGISGVTHRQLNENLSQYMAVGGMPEAVKTWRDTDDLSSCQKVHTEIIAAYREDFGKYAKLHQLKYVDLIFDKVPALLTQKIKYTNISTDYKARELAPGFDLLEKAGVLHKVYHTSASGPPIGSGMNIKHYKSIFLDVALTQVALSMDLGGWILHPEKSLSNKGEIVEAFVGQEILAYSNPERKERLFYWHREEKSSTAEIDYLIQKNEKLIPIEVKSNRKGGLKSINLYGESNLNAGRGIHFYSGMHKKRKAYDSLPLYSVVKLFKQESYFI